MILLLGGVAWIGSHDLDPANPLASNTPPLEIQGVSLDWKWLFIYPGATGRKRKPAGGACRRAAHFSLTSGSVMTAFFVPQLGSMIYTMNGMTTQLNLRADNTGTLFGLPATSTVTASPDMHFDTQAVPAERFTAWIDATRQAGPTLNAASYEDLAKQSMNVAPFTFRAVDPTLFQQIVTQQLPPGPGPQSGHPNPSVSPRTGH